MGTQLYPYCIYTTIGPEKLKTAKDGSGGLVESRVWKTGWELLQKAREANKTWQLSSVTQSMIVAR
jgi:hypothetical protein